MTEKDDKRPKLIIGGMEVPTMDPEISMRLREMSENASAIRVNQDLVARYTLFHRVTGAKCDVVYHPCSGTDVSPSRAFPDSKVLYVETDKGIVESLKKDGLDAHYASALEFDPGDIDVLIMINPIIDPDRPARYVVSGGYVLCNNYHETATRLRGIKDFKFVAIIRHDKEKGLMYDTEGLDDCWCGKKGGGDDLFVFQRI